MRRARQPPCRLTPFVGWQVAGQRSATDADRAAVESAVGERLGDAVEFGGLMFQLVLQIRQFGEDT